MNKNTKSRYNLKTTAIALLVSLATLVTGLELTDTTHLLHDRSAEINETAQNQPYSGAASDTDAGSDSATSAKDNQPTTTPTAPSNTKKKVTPIITSATQEASSIVIRGYVSGVFEEGGTCTAKLTKDGSNVTGSSTGFENVSYTTCAPIRIARSKFNSSGNWSLILTYLSDTAEGSSTSQSINIK